MASEKNREIQRLEQKLGVEVLWPFLLSILQKEPCHAYVLRKKIEQRFGFLPGNVTAYVVLYKLEERGYVKAHPEGNKKIYSITDKGKTLLEEAKKLLIEKANEL